MARWQLLIPLILWAAWVGGPLEVRNYHVVDPLWGVAIYLLSLLVMVIFARRFARRAMEQTTAGRNEAIGRFHLTLFALRWLLLCVHGAALYVMGWGLVVMFLCGPLRGEFATPSAMLSMVPVVLAWVGLTWAQYPLDRAVREQNVLWAFDRNEPMHVVPTLGEYVSNAVRTNVLVTLVPVGVVMLLRDATYFALDRFDRFTPDTAAAIATIVPIAVVLVFAPELLRRIFPTESLPPSPLRERLEAMCQRLGLRYRDILLWHTHNAIGNAAVMGMLPQVRYVMLSDLILQTMNERQIEAVFAHEAGHIKHRHLTWFALFAVSFLMLIRLLETPTMVLWKRAEMPWWLPADLVLLVVGMVGFFFALGALSRQFERQADLFAARSVVPDRTDALMLPQASSGAAGAEVFNSALIHVARINNMPLDAGRYHGRGSRLRNFFGRIAHQLTAWRHGSIRSRIVHLQELAIDPSRTRRFDRRMLAMRVALLLGFLATGLWALQDYLATRAV